VETGSRHRRWRRWQVRCVGEQFVSYPKLSPHFLQHANNVTIPLELLARCKSAAQSAETDLLAGVTQTDEIAVRRWLVQVAKHLDAVRE
jgi:hypothetical protein